MRRNAHPIVARDLVRAIEAELLDLDWRRRRLYLQAAEESLAEADGGLPAESPTEYARSFRAALDLPPREPTPIERPLLRIWPAPTTWVLAGLAGMSVLLGVLLAVQIIGGFVFYDQPWNEAARRAVDVVLPIPRILGTRYVGLFALLAAWACGQLVVGAAMRFWPDWRKRVTVVAAVTAVITLMIALYGLS